MPNDQSWSTVAASPAERLVQDITLPATYRPFTAPVISAEAASATSITITLVTPSNSGAQYQLQRSQDLVNWTTFENDLTEADFEPKPVDIERIAETQYFYRALAQNPHASAYSAVVSATTLAGESPPVDGGIGSVTYSLAADEELATLTLTSDGTTNFGVGPILSYYADFSDLAVGDPSGGAPLIGTATYERDAIYSPPVMAVPEMPYGRGIPVGYTTNGGTVKNIRIMEAQREVEIFEALVICFPAENEANALAISDAEYQTFLDTGTTAEGNYAWQVKSWWHQATNDAGDNSIHGTSWFGGMTAHVNGGFGWTQGFKYSGNALISGGGDPGTSFLDGGRTWRNAPMYREMWARSAKEGEDPTDHDAHYTLVDSSEGVIIDQVMTGDPDLNNWSAGRGDTWGWKYHRLIGYVRGHYIDQNAHMYFGIPYLAKGRPGMTGPAGAAARVVITDSAIWANRRLVTICTCSGDDWGPNSITATLRRGPFWQTGVTGQHLWWVDATNTPHYVAQIGV